MQSITDIKKVLRSQGEDVDEPPANASAPANAKPAAQQPGTAKTGSAHLITKSKTSKSPPPLPAAPSHTQQKQPAALPTAKSPESNPTQPQQTNDKSLKQSGWDYIYK